MFTNEISNLKIIQSLRGLISLAVGVLVLVWTDIALQVFMVVFGFYLLINGGIFVFNYFFKKEEGKKHLFTLIAGILEILLAILTFLNVEVMASAYFFLVAAWLVLVGVYQVVSAVYLHREFDSPAIAVVVGLIFVAGGILLGFWPYEGAKILIRVVGVVSLASGVLAFYRVYRLQKISRTE